MVWVILGWAAYQSGLSEADQLMDEHLASVAAWLAQSPPPAAVDRIPVYSGRAWPQPSLSMSVSNAAGRVTFRSGPAPLPPTSLLDGYATAPLGPAGRAWCIYTHTAEGGTNVSVLVCRAQRHGLPPGDPAPAPAIRLRPSSLARCCGARAAPWHLHALSEQVRTADCSRARCMNRSTRNCGRWPMPCAHCRT